MTGDFLLVLLCFFLCIACYYDYRFCRIPNWLILTALGLGMTKACLAGGGSGMAEYLFWGIVVTLALYPFFRIGTIGGGDVKLYGVCSGFFPADKILFFLFFSLLFAALFSMIRFVKRADLKERLVYLLAYVKDMADGGAWRLYFNDLQEKREAGICLAGPIFISVLLFWGGLY